MFSRSILSQTRSTSIPINQLIFYQVHLRLLQLPTSKHIRYLSLLSPPVFKHLSLEKYVSVENVDYVIHTIDQVAHCIDPFAFVILLIVVPRV